jgi:HD-GYP domain-containing protein (c-di-GMP phosphodiesterase class II)
MTDRLSYFSVHRELIQVGKPLMYDLYVNSSALKDREKFIRIFPSGQTLSREEVDEFHHKYLQLYVSEEQRRSYLHSLVHQEGVDDVQKSNVLKNSAIKYLHQIFDKDKEFSTELLSQSIEGCRDVVESMVDVLDHHGIDSLRGLIANLSFHDFYTFDHSINVSMYCITIYRALNPRASRLELMHAGLGGLLHDLGKIKIPTHILNSPGGLSDEDYGQIKKHPDYGFDLLLNGHCKVSDDIDLKIISRVVHEHHENWNGTGYPNKLAEEQIHLLARVCTIADFFDAITTKRSYNEVLPISDAMNVMRKYRAVKLDPKIFDVFDHHVHYVRAEFAKDLRLSDRFDPTLPYDKLPVEEIKSFGKEMNFGKIKVVDPNAKKPTK